MYESVARVTNESQLMDLLGEFVGEKVNHIIYRQQTVNCLVPKLYIIQQLKKTLLLSSEDHFYLVNLASWFKNLDHLPPFLVFTTS